MIAIIDYGMGNLRSVQKALQHVGADARIVRTPAALGRGGKVVLPGVGAFAEAMARLERQGLIGPLVEAVREGVPLLGICLGLQLLFDVSHEDGQHTGLGMLPGKVDRFDFGPRVTAASLRIPHMGWNQISFTRPCPLLVGVQNGAYVYFAHSYHVDPIDSDVTATTTDYGYSFTSSVWRGNVFGTQFHPEKSQAVGLKILENFVKL